MKQTTQLANRLNEVIINGRWIANTNFMDLISEVTWEQAIRQIGNLNTIAALTYHINYYIAGVLNVLEGGTLDIRDKYSFDLPPIQSKADWEHLVDTLRSNTEKMARAITLMDDAGLADDFVDKKYGNYQRNLEAIIEHSYYHLGQVSLIKKLLITNHQK